MMYQEMYMVNLVISPILVDPQQMDSMLVISRVLIYCVVVPMLVHH